MLSELVEAEHGFGQFNIRHYNFRRTITMEADIDEQQINTVEANELIMDEWKRIQGEFPSIDLDFTGQLDDIEESLDALKILFLLGLGCIYIILGTQFRSYWQPFMILMTVPLAFTGVVLGLLVTNNPMSLYTLYGVVALAGISVNSAIVMISSANQRLENGMSVLHAIVYSARRRVIPILITSLSTIAGLFHWLLDWLDLLCSGARLRRQSFGDCPSQLYLRSLLSQCFIGPSWKTAQDTGSRNC